MCDWRLAAVAAAVLLLLACSDDAGSSSDPEPDAGDSGADSSGDLGDLINGSDVFDVDSGPDVDSGEPDAADASDDSASDVLPDAGDVAPDFPDGPPVITFTVNALPASVNGSLPYDDGGEPTEFKLAVPTWGLTFDVLADRQPAGLDPDTLEVTCDQPLGDDGDDGDWPSGTNLAELFGWDAQQVRWVVTEEQALPVGLVTCEARVGNLEGELSEWSSVTVDAVTRTPAIDPFDEPDVWVITFSRDRYDVDLEIDGGDYIVTGALVEDGNGEADFDEDLRLLGFGGDESGEGAATLEARGVVGVNAVMRAWIIDETIRQVRQHYLVDPSTGLPVDLDSVRIHLLLETDPDAPDPSAFDDTFSIHAVGGDAPPEDPGLFGRATAVDIQNTSSQDDSQLGYGSFTTNVARTVIEQPAGRFILSEILPGFGNPMGELDVDATILADDFDSSTAEQGERFRYRELTFALELYTKALAALIAHEIGHSLGLVACGPPPRGLFSGVGDQSFIETDAGCGHIDTPGLNIMQTGGSLLANPQDLAGDVGFGPLSLAYLQRRVLVVR